MPRSMIKKSAIFLILLISILLWFLWIIPRLEQLPSNFSYKVDVISFDNFYDEEKQTFLGPQISKTKFYYEPISQKNGVLMIRNVFDVYKMTDEKIFAVERLYGIDAKTGQHAKGYGDHNREGYLFAPKHLKKQDYVYWHINYDEPATMRFQDEEKIQGLTVYRYACDYHADQTANLGFLPGVPKERGMNLDINLQQWIEPVSGHMIKYEDKTTAYYYDMKTKERMHPWNKFNNRYSTTGINEQVKIAKQERRKIIFYERVIPSLLAGIVLMLFVFPYFLKRRGV